MDTLPKMQKKDFRDLLPNANPLGTLRITPDFRTSHFIADASMCFSLKNAHRWTTLVQKKQECYNVGEISGTLEFLGQLFWVDLIRWVSNVRPSVRTGLRT